MDFMFSMMFGGGVAAFVYSKMERRLGAGNSQNIWTVVGISFLAAVIFCYTLFAFVLGIH
ncbi:MAG TPA: hypothetical protein VHB51_00735 [Candidatus Saccharimonadales bacterium]|nr:hypothetical protein [Candidatus Saccharimonadales bacterium]